MRIRNSPPIGERPPQIVWVARTDGSHEYYNKHWYDYTGLTLENSTEEAWRELFHPDDRERAEAIWAKALREGTPYEIEFRLKRGARRTFTPRSASWIVSATRWN